MALFLVKPNSSLNPSFNFREIQKVEKGPEDLSIYITFSVINDLRLYLRFFKEKIYNPKITLFHSMVTKDGNALSFYNSAHYKIGDREGIYEQAKFEIHADLEWIFNNKPILNLYKTLADGADTNFTLEFSRLNMLYKLIKDDNIT